MATKVKFEVTRETAYNVLHNAVATTNADPYLIEGELIDELFNSLEKQNLEVEMVTAEDEDFEEIAELLIDYDCEARPKVIYITKWDEYPFYFCLEKDYE